MKVIVVGAGVIGASIAWHLSRAGAEVVVIDSGAPAASSKSFGWINASFYADTAHHHLRAAGLAAYGRMLSALPDLPVDMCGALWWEAQGAELRQMQADLETLDYPVEVLSTQQAAELEPSLQGLPEELLRFPAEGVADVGALAAALLTASGAQVVSGGQVSGITDLQGRVSGLETSAGKIAAHHVVIAAGNGAPEILSSVGISLPMLVRPGALVTTKPVAAVMSQVLVTPHGEVRQLPDGRILASAVANHQGDSASAITEKIEDIAARVLGWLDPLIADETLDWDRVAIAHRPVPRDGLPVIGAIGPKGLHVAVMHSGVTLAGIVGEAVASEVLGQGDVTDLLAPYRPQRFQ